MGRTLLTTLSFGASGAGGEGRLEGIVAGCECCITKLFHMRYRILRAVVRSVRDGC